MVPIRLAERGRGVSSASSALPRSLQSPARRRIAGQWWYATGTRASRPRLMAGCYPAGGTPAYHRPRLSAGYFPVGTRASRPRLSADYYPVGTRASRPRLMADYYSAGGTPAYHTPAADERLISRRRDACVPSPAQGHCSGSDTSPAFTGLFRIYLTVLSKCSASLI